MQDDDTRTDDSTSNPAAASGAAAWVPQSQDERKAARKRIEKKRAWTAGLATYVIVNAFLVGLWAMTGRGYFWPGWVLGGWGIGVALGFWDAFMRRPISEADVDAELRRG